MCCSSSRCSLLHNQLGHRHRHGHQRSRSRRRGDRTRRAVHRRARDRSERDRYHRVTNTRRSSRDDRVGQAPARPGLDRHARLERPDRGLERRAGCGAHRRLRASDRSLAAAAERADRRVRLGRGYIDGLVLRVIEPVAATAAAPVTLTYTSASSAATTYSFDLGALEQGPVKIDAGNGYVMVAVELGEKTCNHGFMRGRWHALDRRTPACYRGIVADADGAAHRPRARHLRPATRPATTTCSASSSRHDGHVRPSHRRHLRQRADRPRASWIDQAAATTALVHGHYFEASTAELGGGFVARCAESELHRGRRELAPQEPKFASTNRSRDPRQRLRAVRSLGARNFGSPY